MGVKIPPDHEFFKINIYKKLTLYLYMNKKSNKSDIIDIYSFGIFLNTHLFTYKYILANNNLFGSIFNIFIKNGGLSGDRTQSLQVKSLLLYQLS